MMRNKGNTDIFSYVVEAMVSIFIVIVFIIFLGPVLSEMNPGSGWLFVISSIIMIIGIIAAVLSRFIRG
jgi:ABC-type multidrug transport system permease subunit